VALGRPGKRKLLWQFERGHVRLVQGAANFEEDAILLDGGGGDALVEIAAVAEKGGADADHGLGCLDIRASRRIGHRDEEQLEFGFIAKRRMQPMVDVRFGEALLRQIELCFGRAATAHARGIPVAVQAVVLRRVRERRFDGRADFGDWSMKNIRRGIFVWHLSGGKGQAFQKIEGERTEN